jgi:hypothetical protein
MLNLQALQSHTNEERTQQPIFNPADKLNTTAIEYNQQVLKPTAENLPNKEVLKGRVLRIRDITTRTVSKHPCCSKC